MTQKNDPVKQQYLQRGKEITKATQTELLKNVSNAIQAAGPGFAIEFCNIRALALIDSLSKQNNCQIKRIAIKYRNPVDMPQTESEITQINQYYATHQRGDTLQPVVHFIDDRIEYYQPILMAKKACLNCHGIPGTDISKKTLEKIKQCYPNDLATGFAIGDIRGAWKITFIN